MKTKEKFIEEIYDKVRKAEATDREKRIRRTKIYRNVSAAAACFIVFLGIIGYSIGDFRDLVGMKAEESASIATSEPSESFSNYGNKDNIKEKASAESLETRSYNDENNGDIKDGSISDSVKLETSVRSSDSAKLSLMSIELVNEVGTEYYSINKQEDADKVETWIKELSSGEAMGSDKFNLEYPDKEPDSYCIINLTKEKKEVGKIDEYLAEMHEPDSFEIDTGEDSGYISFTWYVVKGELPKLSVEINN